MKQKKRVRVWEPFHEMVPDLNLVNALPDQMKQIMDDRHEWRMFQNNLYNVQAKIEQSGIQSDEHPEGMPILHLSIRRLDRKVVRSWRDLQRIKSEIAGADCDAVELFPAEDRVLDGANQYHLYCLPPGQRFPFGEWSRAVAEPHEFGDALRAHGATEEQIATFKGQQEPFEWDKDQSINEPGMVSGFSDLEVADADRV